jgi:putative aldouronate transport system permease protein
MVRAENPRLGRQRLTPHKNKQSPLLYDVKRNYELYLLSLPVFIYFIVFHYGPMYGVQIAFKDFVAGKGIMGSPWVGFEHFERFLRSYNVKTLIKNTLGINIYSLVVGFPAPIILALMLNEVKRVRFKKAVQMVTYAPHFISTVVMVGMVLVFLSPSTGIVNHILKAIGFKPIHFMAEPEWFKTIYVFSGIWQGLGWGSIIYVAALSSIDPQLHESAIIDGATKIQRIINIDLPGIMPTITILLILNIGGIMNVGFQKIFLMQNPLNMTASDVISTYVYRVGLQGAEYSFSSAVGLFNSVINCILLVIVNWIARRLGETSLW